MGRRFNGFECRNREGTKFNLSVGFMSITRKKHENKITFAYNWAFFVAPIDRNENQKLVLRHIKESMPHGLDLESLDDDQIYNLYLKVKGLAK